MTSDYHHGLLLRLSHLVGLAAEVAKIITVTEAIRP